MITEHALLSVKPGREAVFELAFAAAQPLIGEMPGFIELTLLRGIESESTYLLLVEWDSVEQHELFRESAMYGEWSALLHHFYDPMPVVEHFRAVPL